MNEENISLLMTEIGKMKSIRDINNELLNADIKFGNRHALKLYLESEIRSIVKMHCVRQRLIELDLLEQFSNRGEITTESLEKYMKYRLDELLALHDFYKLERKQF